MYRSLLRKSAVYALLTFITGMVFQNPVLACPLPGNSLGSHCAAGSDCDGFCNYDRNRDEMEAQAREILQQEIVGKSKELADRNRLKVLGLKSVKLINCKKIEAVFDVKLYRSVRRDASGTATVLYYLDKFSTNSGASFSFNETEIRDYDLSHLTGTGENWWIRKTPCDFFQPEGKIRIAASSRNRPY